MRPVGPHDHVQRLIDRWGSPAHQVPTPRYSPGHAPWWTSAAVTIQCQSVEETPPRAPAPHVHSQCQRPSASHATAGWWLRRAVRLRVMVLMTVKRNGRRR